MTKLDCSVESPDPMDEYTAAPTHVRVWEDGKEWFIDGADNNYNYTEACWSFDTYQEALANVPDFIRETSDRVEWQWDQQRPHRARHLSKSSAQQHIAARSCPA